MKPDQISSLDSGVGAAASAGRSRGGCPGRNAGRGCAPRLYRRRQWAREGVRGGAVGSPLFFHDGEGDAREEESKSQRFVPGDSSLVYSQLVGVRNLPPEPRNQQRLAQG